MPVVKCLDHAYEMGGGGHQNQHVEDLMGRAPDIESAGAEALGYAKLDQCQKAIGERETAHFAEMGP